MLRIDFAWIAPACLCLVVSAGAAAQSQGLKKGPGISSERKSEQGLEYGKAYAGTKEKKRDGDLEDVQDVMNKAGKEKAEKKIREEKSRKDKVARQEKEKNKAEKKNKSEVKNTDEKPADDS